MAALRPGITDPQQLPDPETELIDEMRREYARVMADWQRDWLAGGTCAEPSYAQARRALYRSAYLGRCCGLKRPGQREN